MILKGIGLYTEHWSVNVYRNEKLVTYRLKNKHLIYCIITVEVSSIEAVRKYCWMHICIYN